MRTPGVIARRTPAIESGALTVRLWTGLALLLLGTPAIFPAPEAAAPLVRVGRIDTPVHPVAANYLAKLLREAERDGARLVVVELSTPGGLLSSTREMTSA